jgi:hypothetical protein
MIPNGKETDLKKIVKLIAIMSEVVSLHIHLETLDRRPEILKSDMEKSMKGIGGGK